MGILKRADWLEYRAAHRSGGPDVSGAEPQDTAGEAATRRRKRERATGTAVALSLLLLGVYSLA